MPNHDRGSGHATRDHTGDCTSVTIAEAGTVLVEEQRRLFRRDFERTSVKSSYRVITSGWRRRADRTFQFHKQQLAIFGVDNSSELRFGFLASQAVALKSTSVDYRNDCVPILDQIAAIGALHDLRLIKRKFTATLFLQD